MVIIGRMVFEKIAGKKFVGKIVTIRDLVPSNEQEVLRLNVLYNRLLKSVNSICIIR